MLIPLGYFASSGGGSGSYELISSSILATSTATVSFSAIPATYKHLQIRLVARSTQVATNTSVNVQFNGVATAVYPSHYMYGTGATVASGSNAASTSMFLLDVNGASAAASTFGAMVIDLLDYASTTKNKTVRAFAGTASRVYLDSGLSMATTAVASISLSANASSFVAGSRFSLYGIKG